MSDWLTVQGVQLECLERGQGRPILWLHGAEGLPEAASIDTVDDLAYLYLDLLVQRGVRDAHRGRMVPAR